MATELPPGTYGFELDLSERARSVGTSPAALVYESSKGPTRLVYYTSQDRFLALNGLPKPSNFGMYSGLAFLEESEQLWAIRATSGASIAGGSYVSDRENKCSQISFIPFPPNYPVGYSEGGPEIQQIVYDDVFVAGNTITGRIALSGIQNNVPVNAEDNWSVVFTTSSDNTLELVAQEIRNTLDLYISGHVVEVISLPGSNDDRIIRIIAPANMRMAFTSNIVTGGLSQAEAYVENPKMFDVFAENPGEWGNKVHVKIASLDIGIPQQQTIQFLGPMVAGNVFGCRVTPDVNFPDAYQDVTVNFFGSSDATLANIALAIRPIMGPGASVESIVVGGGSSNDRQIRIVAKDARADFRISSLTVTGGLSRPGVSVSTTLVREAPDNTFLFEIYDYSVSVQTPVETYTASLANQQDGDGYNIKIDQLINAGPRKSEYVRVFQNDSAEDMILDVTDLLPRPLQGGDDGFKPSNTVIINTWNQTFGSRRKVDIRMLINGGNATPAVQKALSNLAIRRRDCMAILDVPAVSQRAQDAHDYRKFTININNSYAALYSPDVLIKSRLDDSLIYVPLSGYAAGVFAKTDRVAAFYFAPAGFTRADLSSKILGLRYEYDEGEQSLLFNNQVNYALNMPGKGMPIFSAETLQFKASALSNINVRRLIIGVEVTLLDSLIFKVFDPNNAATRYEIRQINENFLEPIAQGEAGLYAYEVVCDARNNTPATIDEGTIVCDDFLQPTIPAKRLKLTSVITRTGASFQESQAAIYN